MSSEISPTLDSGNAATPSEPRNRLALVSFWLSLSPAVLNGPAILGLVASAVIGGLAAPITNLVNSNLFSIAALALLGVSNISAITAIVTGVMALIRAKRYQTPQQARRGLATWGVVLGSLGMVILICLDILVIVAVLVTISCSAAPADCH